ncbi:MAG: cell wall hydrolase [Clostridiales bacterium]|nr:cell wall hydrolase [Clostridiales bacterium]
MERISHSPRKVKGLRKSNTARSRFGMVTAAVKRKALQSVLMGAIAGAVSCGIAGADTRGVVAVSECSVSLDIIDSGPYVVSVNTVEAPLFYPYTEEEVTMIAAIIQCEAGNQSDDGQRYVADSILNRVDSPWFPNTVLEVINQPGQYSTRKKAARLAKNGNIPLRCYGNAIYELTARTNREIIYFGRGYGSGEPLFKEGDHCFSGISKKKKEIEKQWMTTDL